MSAPIIHMGILREENIALRCILGYNLATIDDSPYPVPYLGECLDRSQIKDILLISVDVDHPRISLALEEQNYHIGISVFDTRCLVRPINSNEEAIVSYQFITKPAKSCLWAAKRFLFGSTELVSLPTLGDRIKQLTRGRHYAFVGHQLGQDIRLIRHIDASIVERALYLIDTVKLAQFPLQLYYRYKLEELLDALGIASAKLHTAGNDAHFALKALLLLPTWDALQTGIPQLSYEKALLRRLRGMATAPIPPPVQPQDRPRIEEPVKPKKLGVMAKGRIKRTKKLHKALFKELPMADFPYDYDLDSGYEPSKEDSE